MTVFIVDGRQFECAIVSTKDAKLGLTYLAVSSPRSLGMRRLVFGLASAKDNDMWISEKTYGAINTQSDDDWVVNYKQEKVLLFYDTTDPLYHVVSIDGIRLGQ